MGAGAMSKHHASLEEVDNAARMFVASLGDENVRLLFENLRFVICACDAMVRLEVAISDRMHKITAERMA